MWRTAVAALIVGAALPAVADASPPARAPSALRCELWLPAASSPLVTDCLASLADTVGDGQPVFGNPEHPDSFSATVARSMPRSTLALSDPGSGAGVVIAESVASVAAIPEPGTYTLLAAGLLPLLWMRRRHQRIPARRLMTA